MNSDSTDLIGTSLCALAVHNHSGETFVVIPEETRAYWGNVEPTVGVIPHADRMNFKLESVLIGNAVEAVIAFKVVSNSNNRCQSSANRLYVYVDGPFTWGSVNKVGVGSNPDDAKAHATSERDHPFVVGYMCVCGPCMQHPVVGGVNNIHTVVVDIDQASSAVASVSFGARVHPVHPVQPAQQDVALKKK